MNFHSLSSCRYSAGKNLPFKNALRSTIDSLKASTTLSRGHASSLPLKRLASAFLESAQHLIRKVCIDIIEFNPDGTIIHVIPTLSGYTKPVCE